MTVKLDEISERAMKKMGEIKKHSVSASFSNELLCDKEKYISVPVAELKKLEEARQALYDDIYDDLTLFKQMELSNLTQQIWRVANTKKWD